MNELKFNSQLCTTKEQSQRLLDLGLKPETADCFHWSYSGTNYIGNIDEECLSEEDIPAWSLHRLICLYGKDYTIKELYNGNEECYGMLITAIQIAIENDEFNKEYLKLNLQILYVTAKTWNVK